MIKHHYLDLFKDDPVWLPRAQELSEKIYEFSEFLVRFMEVTDIGASLEKRVTYHDSCQVLRGLGIRDEPRKLLENVRSLDFLEMDRSDKCCGFGGIFSFKSPEIAGAMAKDKVESILQSGAQIVTGCEISCLMHIGAALERGKHPVRAVHLASLLAQGL
jgi:L-lactate dehydrogenase complex protein LldE